MSELVLPVWAICSVHTTTLLYELIVSIVLSYCSAIMAAHTGLLESAVALMRSIWQSVMLSI
ncbi:MAG: hypothetical protein MR933_00280 [Prevotella sp.]|uniref:hypothetical protein n=1 Tax=Prevotella sp. TaxID=59823 RepID=UPI0025E46452|nr:hypothetical protein [Prevotella sp.]MCI7118230.1 hypothetical protein [Prevotella sp.]